MGLDMYLYITKVERLGKDEEEFDTELHRTKQIGYWRKDYELHEWMHKLHGKLTPAEYNCVKTYLDKDQLLQLMNSFPQFQDTFGDALEWLERGYHVYYDSWW